jgi:hypothetical protein
MCCQASYMRCSHYRSVVDSRASRPHGGRVSISRWPDVAIVLEIQGDSVSPMPFTPLPGSRRTTKVKRELGAEVPQAVAREPPPDEKYCTVRRAGAW